MRYCTELELTDKAAKYYNAHSDKLMSITFSRKIKNMLLSDNIDIIPYDYNHRITDSDCRRMMICTDVPITKLNDTIIIDHIPSSDLFVRMRKWDELCKILFRNINYISIDIGIPLLDLNKIAVLGCEDWMITDGYINKYTLFTLCKMNEKNGEVKYLQTSTIDEFLNRSIYRTNVVNCLMEPKESFCDNNIIVPTMVLNSDFFVNRPE